MDPLILAGHIMPEKNAKILDIGTGCGIIPMLLSARYPHLDILGIEIQKELYDCACKNIQNHGCRNVQLFHKNVADLRISDIGDAVTHIVSNPPYRKKTSSRISPDPQKAIACHDIHLDLPLFFTCAGNLLKDHGSLYLIFPADRLSDLLVSMAAHRFSACRIRFIHPRKTTPARRVVVHALKKKAAHCTILPPLFVLNSRNTPTREYLSMVTPWFARQKPDHAAV